MYTPAVYRTVILFLMYTYCPSSCCSENKQYSYAEYCKDLGKDEIIISFDSSQQTMVPLDSRVGLCLNQKYNKFFLSDNDFFRFIASFQNCKKRNYLNENKTTIFQISTIDDLGGFLDHVQRENYIIALLKPDGTNNEEEIKKVVNALFMFTFLQKKGLLNNCLNIDKKYSEFLINFSNNLFSALLKDQNFSYPGTFFLSKMDVQ